MPTTALHLLMISLFGALGAVSRYLVSGWAHQLLGTSFAYGTLTVNVIGCFLLGLLMHVGLTTDLVSDVVRTRLAIGFLGAFTTFSTFGYETLSWLEQRQWLLASANVAGNLLLGLLAVWAGVQLARLLVGGA